MYELQCGRDRSYRVQVLPDLLRPDNPALAAALVGRRSLVVTTPTVHRLLGQQLLAYAVVHRLAVDVLVLPLTEATKTPETVLDVCRRALSVGVGRFDALVSLGGGICCDVVSVAASLLRRGLAHICLPTTLLAQVDAGIGLKGGVNLDGRKNVVGCFEPPAAVLLDPGWLRTLPTEQVRNGLAEILKITAIADPDAFALLERHGPALVRDRMAGPTGDAAVRTAIRLMLAELAANPWETGTFERPADFGHTVSGALEERSDYRLAHGSAVSVDMTFSVSLGRVLGLVADADAERFVRAQVALGLPTWSPLLDEELVAGAVRTLSAQRGGRLNLVVPAAIGTPAFVADGSSLDAGAVSAALSWMRGLVSRTEDMASAD